MARPVPTPPYEERIGRISSKNFSPRCPFTLTVSLALRTGQLDGENQARGIRIPLSDLLIGVTALELGFSVGTVNLRHFRQVPGLSVVQL